MKYRPLGDTGLWVSEIGFGGLGIGGIRGGAIAYGPTEDAESVRTIEAAFDQGVTFYDTSDLYGFGHSERLLGRALRKARSKVVLASKVGFLDFKGTQDFSPGHLRKALENSLRRLRTDYLDLYQLHSPPIQRVIADPAIMGTLREMETRGLIRAIGISARSPEEGLEAIVHCGIKALQVNLSLLDQRAIDIGLVQTALRTNVGLIARTPLAYGFLAGSQAGKPSYPRGDHRADRPPDQIKLWKQGGERLGAFVRGGRQTTGQFALRFCLSQPAVATVIPGMLTVEHVRENVGAARLGPLPRRTLRRVRTEFKSAAFFPARRNRTELEAGKRSAC